MKRHNPRVWPQHQLLHNLIRARLILGIRLSIKRHKLPNLLIPPSPIEICMPEGKVFEFKDLPDAVFFDVFVFVEAAFPPLDEAARVRFGDGFVRSCGHECTETTKGTGPVGGNVDYVLHLGVVEEETVDGAISSFDKAVCEAADVQSVDSFFLSVSTSNEFNEGVWVVGKEVDDLDLSQ